MDGIYGSMAKFYDRLNAGLDYTVVMTFQFLTLRGGGTEQRSTRVYEVFTLFKQFFIDEKVFLFGADRCFD